MSMVDCRATSHIVPDLAKLKRFDDGFQAKSHCVELADGTRCRGVAERRGDAEVIDSKGRHLNTTLRQALYIPSYPQDILSVKAATASRATVVFKKGTDALIHKDEVNGVPMQDLQLPLPSANGLPTIDVQSIHEQAVKTAKLSFHISLSQQPRKSTEATTCINMQDKGC
ncbi:uncharacterized protein AB9X84_025239 isoform 2-T2 [Acanthopagrus schlegelii]